MSNGESGPPSSKYTRGEFLGLAGLLAGAAVTRALPAAAPAPDPRDPDLILINGNVYTLDDALPRAQAFAVKQGRFVAIGSNGDIRNLAASRTQVIDAARMTVTPGFIDAHCHPSGVDELYEVSLNLPTIEAIKTALHKKAADTPPDFWVTGFNFDDTKLRDKRPLRRQDLDEAVPDHPVAVYHRSGHLTWFNTRAFGLAGINHQTPQPEGGRFERDEQGQLTGMVAELARDAFRNVGKRVVFTPEEQRKRGQAGMAHMSELLTAAGLTTVHDAHAERDRILAYQDAYRANGLRHRAYLMCAGSLLDALKSIGVYTGFGDEWLRVGGLKFFADGSASGRTMRMSTPYVGRPNDYGILTMTQQEIHDVVEDAHRHDFQVGIHANGDEAIDMVLKAYERVLEKWPHPDRRHRIEHCTLVNPDLLRRIKATGTIPAPFWTYVHYHGEKWGQYGEQKLRWMFAHRSFLDAGIPVPGASDYPPGPFEPLMAIQSMVTRKDSEGRVWGANQRVGVDQALRIATIHGARVSREEHLKGSITVGKLADFVMLERDPHQVDPDQIKNIKVARTVVGGRTMHPKESG